jgi:hypothetical protein
MCLQICEEPTAEIDLKLLGTSLESNYSVRSKAVGQRYSPPNY